MKNRSSFSLLFAVASTVITAVAIGVALWLWQDLKKDKIRDLHYAHSVISRYYELSFNQWRNTLLNLGNRLYAVEGGKVKLKRQAIVDKAITNYDELLAFGYASPEGDVLTFSGADPSDSLPNLMMSDNSRRSFIDAQKTDYISIGEAYYFPNVLDWILPMRVPIRDSLGQLLAVNTTALQYKTMNNDLNGFGFDPNYRVCLINDAFNTIQFYFPLPAGDYPEILRNEATIYQELEENQWQDITYYEGSNIYEGKASLIIMEPLERLQHSLVISVDSSVLIQEFIPALLFIAGVYVVLMIVVVAIYLYSKKKEREYLASLVESEANLKSIFESTNNIIGLFDTDKKLIEFKQAFAEAAKFTDNLVLEKGMGVEVLSKNPEMTQKFIDFQSRALQGEKFSETIEYPIPDGNIIYFLLSYNPIFQGKKIIGLSMFVQDITELKNYQTNLENIVKERTKELETKNDELEAAIADLKTAQQKLVQAEKMASLGVLSAGIGHEINNPLNFIKNGATGLIQALKEQKGVDLSQIQPFFEIIETGVERASSIVKSLSHFSRQVKTMDEACHLPAIIENCLTILQNRLKNRIDVKLDFAQDCPPIIGNEGKLHQAILNILSNAEQAITEKGEIKIQTTFTNNSVTLTVADTGEGIAEDHLNKIADPFFTTKDPGIGTGLGLFITYNIVEEHNGSVKVTSVKGEGTRFTITFSL